MPCILCIQNYNHPLKNTSILALLDVGLSNNPDPLPRGLPPIPRGLPPTPEAYLLLDNPEELLGRCCIGVEKEEVAEPVKAR